MISSLGPGFLKVMVDNVVHQINHYTVDSKVCFVCPGYCIHVFMYHKFGSIIFCVDGI